MRQRLIFRLTVALVAFVLPAARAEMQVLDGRTDRVDRGDLLIPVTATGVAAASEIVEVKAAASGRVNEISVGEGQMVKAGALLVRLDPSDEQRTVERLQADLDRVAANHDQSRIREREAQENRPLDVQAAQSFVDQARAVHEGLQIQVDKLRQLSPEAKSDLEEKKTQAALNSANAALAKAVTELQRTRNYAATAIASAHDDMVAADALLRAARKQLDEGQRRLKETTIAAPMDGMIYSIAVRKGEAVQSSAGNGGGTVLLYIANVSKMYVIAQVDQSQIGPVRRMAPEFAQPGTARSVTDTELFASAPLPAAEDPPAPLLLDARPSLGSLIAVNAAPTNAAVPRKPAASSAPAASPAPPGKPAASVPRCRRVKIYVEAYPDETFEGVIERILPEPRVVAGASYFEVRIRLLGSEVAKLLSLQVNVHFASELRKNALRVSSQAVAYEGKEAVVYVPYREKPDDAWGEKRVRVQVGRTDGIDTEILAGLRQGDLVWTQRPRHSEQSDTP